MFSLSFFRCSALAPWQPVASDELDSKGGDRSSRQPADDTAFDAAFFPRADERAERNDAESCTAIDGGDVSAQITCHELQDRIGRNKFVHLRLRLWSWNRPVSANNPRRASGAVVQHDFLLQPFFPHPCAIPSVRAIDA